MRRMASIGTAAATLLLVAGLSAQGTPNFAGKWTMVPSGEAAAGGGGGGRGGGRGGGGGAGFVCGQECTITQDAKSLTITRSQPGREGGAPTEIKTVVMLDGSDSKNTMPGRGGNPGMEVVSKAKWDGNKLVVSTTRDMQGTAVTSTQTISMEGGSMVVESSSGREGQPPAKTTYKKG